MTTSSSEAPLSERQSLDLIQTMIRQAQNRLTNDGSHLIWWGSLVLTAALGHYALLHTALAEYAGYMWLLMLVGGIGAVVIGRQQERAKGAKTFVDRVMGAVWGSIGLAIGLIFLLAILTNSWRIVYPAILMLYGIGLFTTGSVVRYRPMIFSGVLCWALAIGAALVNFEGQLLCMAGAALVGFLVPGLMTRSQYQHAKNTLPDAASAI